jgi:hypothetical protein
MSSHEFPSFDNLGMFPPPHHQEEDGVDDDASPTSTVIKHQLPNAFEKLRSKLVTADTPETKTFKVDLSNKKLLSALGVRLSRQESSKSRMSPDPPASSAQTNQNEEFPLLSKRSCSMGDVKVLDRAKLPLSPSSGTSFRRKTSRGNLYKMTRQGLRGSILEQTGVGVAEGGSRGGVVRPPRGGVLSPNTPSPHQGRNTAALRKQASDGCFTTRDNDDPAHLLTAMPPLLTSSSPTKASRGRVHGETSASPVSRRSRTRSLDRSSAHRRHEMNSSSAHSSAGAAGAAAAAARRGRRPGGGRSSMSSGDPHQHQQQKQQDILTSPEEILQDISSKEPRPSSRIRSRSMPRRGSRSRSVTRTTTRHSLSSGDTTSTTKRITTTPIRGRKSMEDKMLLKSSSGDDDNPDDAAIASNRDLLGRSSSHSSFGGAAAARRRTRYRRTESGRSMQAASDHTGGGGGGGENNNNNEDHHEESPLPFGQGQEQGATTQRSRPSSRDRRTRSRSGGSGRPRHRQSENGGTTTTTTTSSTIGDTTNNNAATTGSSTDQRPVRRAFRKVSSIANLSDKSSFEHGGGGGVQHYQQQN